MVWTLQKKKKLLSFLILYLGKGARHALGRGEYGVCMCVTFIPWGRIWALVPAGPPSEPALNLQPRSRMTWANHLAIMNSQPWQRPSASPRTKGVLFCCSAQKVLGMLGTNGHWQWEALMCTFLSLLCGLYLNFLRPITVELLCESNLKLSLHRDPLNKSLRY